MKSLPLVGLVAAVLIGSAGCASKSEKPVYSTSQTGVILREQRGEILAVRDVTIKDQPINPAGPGRRVGAAVGTVAGSGGSIERAGAVLGAQIGGDLGAALDTKDGEEITIRLENDSVIIVVQERGDTPLAPGERVRVITGSGASVGTIGAILRGGGMGGNTRVEREANFAGDLRVATREGRQFSQ